MARNGYKIFDSDTHVGPYVDVLDKFGEGQEVEVSFRIRGREYNGKYFNNIEAWRVEAIGEAPKPAEVKEEDPLPF